MKQCCLLILAMVLGGAQAAEVERNSLGMAFVRLPAGEFLMGSDEPPESLAAAYGQLPRERFAQLGDEGPVHRVRITHSFWMGRHEVTVGQFRRFVEASGYVPESVADGTGGYGWRADYDPATTKRGDAFEGRDPRYSWRNPGFAQGDDHPVVNVTWNDAQALAAWLSKTEGRRYRLPTEAEWEYACRAGTRSRYSSGDDPHSLLGAANVFDANSARYWPRWQPMALDGDDGYAFTAPVGSFAPNAWGLYDMHGNAWEWVADWHGEKYYAQSPLDDPQGPAQGGVRVRRGGSWHTWAFYARAAYRNWNAPDTRYTLVGIRLVRED
ncbi:formylglycine-generating enzyme family protein [Variovorax sp. V59]|jgi:formylglycine-generating enzyme required for sulfatase activity|uniref:Formylglycine-generating enzyme required for sulfatase activity n=1 Tax=Variovorax paradoxus TaxID=34073 RepID=A0AAE4BWR2_VARPD|nr:MULTISPECIES: formylglycine-generating enzyme family protein [Variovorax]MBD9667458.1 formylglycine-generating enzyme family protein [Variovorax sp. VRV01]MDR6424685.1 formylglycine-generating enzyme required for sulfatase activity [Variovorax paradoxus]MDR6452041.1 formylglycine-generating enzyme required for sulfatase activity [Variovorax paradoxus]